MSLTQRPEALGHSNPVNVIAVNLAALERIQDDANGKGVPCEEITLHRIKVNRGESGSPSWKEIYFLNSHAAKAALESEHPDNRHSSGAVAISGYYDEIEGKYFISNSM